MTPTPARPITRYEIDRDGCLDEQPSRGSLILYGDHLARLAAVEAAKDGAHVIDRPRFLASLAESDPRPDPRDALIGLAAVVLSLVAFVGACVWIGGRL